MSAPARPGTVGHAGSAGRTPADAPRRSPAGASGGRVGEGRAELRAPGVPVGMARPARAPGRAGGGVVGRGGLVPFPDNCLWDPARGLAAPPSNSRGFLLPASYP